jgi:hypothetical protein
VPNPVSLTAIEVVKPDAIEIPSAMRQPVDRRAGDYAGSDNSEVAGERVRGEVFAARAAEAAVRTALMADASRQASGYPVAASLRIRTAEARARLCVLFSGKLEIHLMPLTGLVPARWAGRAMMRRTRPVRKPKEIAVRVYGPAEVVEPVGHLDDICDSVPVFRDCVLDCQARNDMECRIGRQSSALL